MPDLVTAKIHEFTRGIVLIVYLVPMLITAAVAVTAVLIASLLLLRYKPRLETWLARRGAIQTDRCTRRERRRARTTALLGFLLEYLTDRKNIAVHAVLFPCMLILLIFPIGFPFYLRSLIVLTAIGCNMLRMRVERRRHERTT